MRSALDALRPNAALAPSCGTFTHPRAALTATSVHVLEWLVDRKRTAPDWFKRAQAIGAHAGTLQVRA